jgi:hypothetical protein
MNVSTNLNNLSRFSGGMEGNNMAVLIILGLVSLIAIFVAMWQYEYFGCTNGRMVVDGKCVDMCPEGLKFGSYNEEHKQVSCSKDGILFTPYPTPTPAPKKA